MMAEEGGPAGVPPGGAPVPRVPTSEWSIVETENDIGMKSVLSFALQSGKLLYPPTGIRFPQLQEQDSEITKAIHTKARARLEKDISRKSVKGLGILQAEAKLFAMACSGFDSWVLQRQDLKEAGSPDNINKDLKFEADLELLDESPGFAYPYCNNGAWHGIKLSDEHNPFTKLSDEMLCRACASLIPERNPPKEEDKSFVERYEKRIAKIIISSVPDWETEDVAPWEFEASGNAFYGYGDGSAFREDTKNIVVEKLYEDRNLIKVNSTWGVLNEGCQIKRVRDGKLFPVLQYRKLRKLRVDGGSDIHVGDRFSLVFTEKLQAEEAIAQYEQQMAASEAIKASVDRRIADLLSNLERDKRLVQNTAPIDPINVIVTAIDNDTLLIEGIPDYSCLGNSTLEMNGVESSIGELTRTNHYEVFGHGLEAKKSAKATITATFGVALNAISDRLRQEVGRAETKALTEQQRHLKTMRDLVENDETKRLLEEIKGQLDRLQLQSETNGTTVAELNAQILKLKETHTEMNYFGKQIDVLFESVCSGRFATIAIARGKQVDRVPAKDPFSVMEVCMYRATQKKMGRKNTLAYKLYALMVLKYLEPAFNRTVRDDNFIIQYRKDRYNEAAANKLVGKIRDHIQFRGGGVFGEAAFEQLERYQTKFNRVIYAPGNTRMTRTLCSLYLLLTTWPETYEIEFAEDTKYTIRQLLEDNNIVWTRNMHKAIYNLVESDEISIDLSDRVITAFTEYCRIELGRLNEGSSHVNCGFNAEFALAVTTEDAQVPPFVYRLFTIASFESAVGSMKNSLDICETLDTIQEAGRRLADVLDGENRTEGSLFRAMAWHTEIEAANVTEDADAEELEAEGGSFDLHLYDALTTTMPLFTPLAKATFEQVGHIDAVVSFLRLRMGFLSNYRASLMQTVTLEGHSGSILPPVGSFLYLKMPGEATVTLQIKKVMLDGEETKMEFDFFRLNEEAFKQKLDLAIKRDITFLREGTNVTIKYTQDDLIMESPIDSLKDRFEKLSHRKVEAASLGAALTQFCSELKDGRSVLKEEKEALTRGDGQAERIKDLKKEIANLGLDIEEGEELISEYNVIQGSVQENASVKLQMEASKLVRGTLERLVAMHFFFDVWDESGNEAPPTASGLLRVTKADGKEVDLSTLFRSRYPRVLRKFFKTAYTQAAPWNKEVKRLSNKYRRDLNAKNFEAMIDTLIVESGALAERIDRALLEDGIETIGKFVALALDEVIVDTIERKEKDGRFDALEQIRASLDDAGGQSAADAKELLDQALFQGEKMVFTSFMTNFDLVNRKVSKQRKRMQKLMLMGHFKRSLNNCSIVSDADEAGKESARLIDVNSITLYFHNWYMNFVPKQDFPYPTCIDKNTSKMYAEDIVEALYVLQDDVSTRHYEDRQCSGEKFFANYLWARARDLADSVFEGGDDALIDRYETLIDPYGQVEVLCSALKGLGDGTPFDFDDLYMRFFLARLVANLNPELNHDDEEDETIESNQAYLLRLIGDKATQEFKADPVSGVTPFTLGADTFTPHSLPGVESVFADKYNAVVQKAAEANFSHSEARQRIFDSRVQELLAASVESRDTFRSNNGRDKLDERDKDKLRKEIVRNLKQDENMQKAKKRKQKTPPPKEQQNSQSTSGGDSSDDEDLPEVIMSRNRQTPSQPTFKNEGMPSDEGDGEDPSRRGGAGPAY